MLPASERQALCEELVDNAAAQAGKLLRQQGGSAREREAIARKAARFTFRYTTQSPWRAILDKRTQGRSWPGDLALDVVKLGSRTRALPGQKSSFARFKLRAGAAVPAAAAAATEPQGAGGSWAAVNE